MRVSPAGDVKTVIVSIIKNNSRVRGNHTDYMFIATATAFTSPAGDTLIQAHHISRINGSVAKVIFRNVRTGSNWCPVTHDVKGQSDRSSIRDLIKTPFKYLFTGQLYYSLSCCRKKLCRIFTITIASDLI